MPLLSKRIFNCIKPLSDVKPDEKIYTIPHTKEQLRSQEEYEKRLQLYKKRIWTCQSTGHVNLTHEEAWNSEKAVLKTLKEQFAPCYDKPVLELVHHSTKSLDTLVDEAWLMLQQVLVVGERVLLKVKAGGKSMKAVIVKVDPAGYEGNPTSNCNSPSSDKENKDSNSSTPKKWVPPKLLPYMYSIRFENEDSVIHSVPANDLSRGDKPPSKELLRLFIRTYAVRAGHTPNSPWIVDDAQVKKLDLHSKFASFLLSPVKWKADEIAKKIEEETKSIKSAGKGSPRIKSKMDAKEEKRKEKAKKSISKIEKKSEKLKQQKEKQSKKNEVTELDSSDDSSDGESENEEEGQNKSAVSVINSDSDSDTPLSKVKSQLTPKKSTSSKSSPLKSGKKSQSLADLQKKLKGSKTKKPMTLADLQKQLEKKKNKKEKKDKKKSKKGQQNQAEQNAEDFSTDEEVSQSVPSSKNDNSCKTADTTIVIDSDSDSDVPLSQLMPSKETEPKCTSKKEKESKKAKQNESITIVLNEESDSNTTLSQLTPSKRTKDSSKSKSKKKQDHSSAKDSKKQLKAQKKGGKSKQSMTAADLKKKVEKKKFKEGQDPKQMTLIDSLKKKGLKTPDKSSKSPLKSKSSLDMKKKLLSPAKTPVCIEKLLAAMNKGEKLLIGTYATQSAKCLTKTQRENLKGPVRDLVMKKYELIQERNKIAKMSEAERKAYVEKKNRERAREARKKYKNTVRKYEDTMLDLLPLPAPTLVMTPEGLPNELFGDIVMVTDFISCYSGLLMPDDEYPIYTDCFMKALANGKDGFTYLCRTLTVLLQTLLQDQIAEDYEELKVPLSDIPVTPGSCSELVRLCLRKHDMADSKSDTSDMVEEEEECEVPDELLQLLETQEFYELEPTQKLAIFKGLCERVMGTYSVQYYMEETQQKSTDLWKEKFSKIKAKKEEEKLKKENEKEGADDKKKENESNDTDSKKKENDTNGTDNKKKEKSEKDASINNMLLTQFYGKTNENGQSDQGPGTNAENPMTVEDDDGALITTIKRRRLTTAQAQEERRKKEIEEKLRRQEEEEERQRKLQMREQEQFEKEFNEGIALAKLTLRQTPVGTDRNHSRYWIFCSTTPGIYVEKGWVGEEIDYTIRKNLKDDVVELSSSSSDQSEPEDESAAGPPGTAGSKKKNRLRMLKCVDTTFPHVGQNLWFTYDKSSQLNELLDSLHAKGSRESALQKELKRRSDDVYLAVHRYQRRKKELRDCDGEQELKNTFKKELLESELRLRNGGLGGVDDFDTWSTKLETSEDMSTLADCLLESQANVLEKFRDGIMVIKKKKSDNDDIKEENEEEEEKVEAPGIQHWRDAVKASKTMSRLHVLLGILDSCVKWEKSAENAKCKICRKKEEEEKLLLCDDCNQAFHIYCLRPALPCVPKGDWKCIACAPMARKRVIDVPGRYQEESDEDEEIKEAKAQSIKHDETCLECGGDESLILCAECPSAYHLECHDPPLRRPPRGRWVCNDCKNGIKRRTRRGALTQDARKTGRPAAKRKRYTESSGEESSEEESQDSDHNNDYDGETEEEDSRPPPRKVARSSRGRIIKQRLNTTNSKQNSPKNETSRSRSRRSAPSPELVYETRPKVSRRAPSELSLIEDIINKMLAFKAAWPFWHNVSKKDVPDYYNIIKQPISFQKIKDKLNCLVYGSPQEVIDDVALVFRNAVEYNKVGSEVYDCIDFSEKHFIDLLKKYLPFYAYNRDCQSNGYGDHMYSDEGRKSRKSK